MGLGCQVGKEPCYLRLGHFCRMTLVVEKDKPFNPVDIRFLGPRTVVACSDRLADLIESLGFGEVFGVFTTALRSKRSLFSWYTLAFSMLSPRVADAVQR